MVARHRIWSCNLLHWKVFYLPMIGLRHIPCRHMIMEYEGLHCTLVSCFTRDTSQTILTKCQTFFLQSISRNDHLKRFHNQFITKSHSPYQRGPIGLTFNGEEDILMIFLRIISWHCRKSNPKTTIHTKRIPLRLSTSMIS